MVVSSSPQSFPQQYGLAGTVAQSLGKAPEATVLQQRAVPGTGLEAWEHSAARSPAKERSSMSRTLSYALSSCDDVPLRAPGLTSTSDSPSDFAPGCFGSPGWSGTPAASRAIPAAVSPGCPKQALSYHKDSAGAALADALSPKRVRPQGLIRCFSASPASPAQHLIAGQAYGGSCRASPIVCDGCGSAPIVASAPAYLTGGDATVCASDESLQSSDAPRDAHRILATSSRARSGDALAQNDFISTVSADTSHITRFTSSQSSGLARHRLPVERTFPEPDTSDSRCGSVEESLKCTELYHELERVEISLVQERRRSEQLEKAYRQQLEDQAQLHAQDVVALEEMINGILSENQRLATRISALEVSPSAALSTSEPDCCASTCSVQSSSDEPLRTPRAQALQDCDAGKAWLSWKDRFPSAVGSDAGSDRTTAEAPRGIPAALSDVLGSSISSEVPLVQCAK